MRGNPSSSTTSCQIQSLAFHFPGPFVAGLFAGWALLTRLAWDCLLGPDDCCWTCQRCRGWRASWTWWPSLLSSRFYSFCLRSPCRPERLCPSFDSVLTLSIVTNWAGVPLFGPRVLSRRRHQTCWILRTGAPSTSRRSGSHASKLEGPTWYVGPFSRVAGTCTFWLPSGSETSLWFLVQIWCSAVPTSVAFPLLPTVFGAEIWDGWSLHLWRQVSRFVAIWGCTPSWIAEASPFAPVRDHDYHSGQSE